MGHIYKVFIVFSLLIFSVSNGICSLIPKHYLDSVVAIGSKSNVDGKITWIGTGFLYGRLFEINGESSEYHIFLISNKHVFEGKDTLYLKFNPINGMKSRSLKLNLLDKEKKAKWTGHPDSEVDVAAIQINPKVLEKEKLNYAYFRSDHQPQNISKIEYQELSEGDGVFVLGYPMGLVGNVRQYVICRTGCISRIRGFVDGTDKDFLIDSFIFPGNSGGPVILQPNINSIKGTKSTSKADLIGIVKSYIPYRDIAISMQTKKPRVIFEENTGLTAVEPIDYIVETVELEYNSNSKISE